MEINKERLAFIVRHEAGHWLAAHVMGMNPKEIYIKIPINGLAESAYASTLSATELMDINSVANYLKSRIITLYAGVYAANYNRDGFDNEQVIKDLSSSGGGYTDYLKIEELYRLYKNITGDKQDYGKECHEFICNVGDIVVEGYEFTSSLVDYVLGEARYLGQEILIPKEKVIAIYNKSKEKQ